MTPKDILKGMRVRREERHSLDSKIRSNMPWPDNISNDDPIRNDEQITAHRKNLYVLELPYNVDIAAQDPLFQLDEKRCVNRKAALFTLTQSNFLDTQECVHGRDDVFLAPILKGKNPVKELPKWARKYAKKEKDEIYLTPVAKEPSLTRVREWVISTQSNRPVQDMSNHHSNEMFARSSILNKFIIYSWALFTFPFKARVDDTAIHSITLIRHFVNPESKFCYPTPLTRQPPSPSITAIWQSCIPKVLKRCRSKSMTKKSYSFSAKLISIGKSFTKINVGILYKRELEYCIADRRHISRSIKQDLSLKKETCEVYESKINNLFGFLSPKTKIYIDTFNKNESVNIVDLATYFKHLEKRCLKSRYKEKYLPYIKIKLIFYSGLSYPKLKTLRLSQVNIETKCIDTEWGNFPLPESFIELMQATLQPDEIIFRETDERRLYDFVKSTAKRCRVQEIINPTYLRDALEAIYIQENLTPNTLPRR